MGLLNVGVSVVSSLALFARIFEYLDLPVEIDDPADPVRPRPATGRAATCASRTSASATRRSDRPALDRRRPRRARRHHARPGRRDRLRQDAPSPRWSPGCTTRPAGRVTIDGVDVRDLRLADLAAIVGVVSQETYLLHTTVRENLRYARPDATDAEIEDAARAAQIHDLIAGAARRLRHHGRLPRPPVLRRREAAHRHRPHPAARPAGPGARRGDQRAGHRDRAGRAAGVRHAWPRAGPRSPSRTGCPRSATPTRSWSSTTAGSSSAAPTTACSAGGGRYAALAA